MIRETSYMFSLNRPSSLALIAITEEATLYTILPTIFFKIFQMERKIIKAR